ncbi:MAG: polysaccharide deacetylase family protein [Bacteroidetes bacterium]|nr:polysaccharide deacetylase family protein [Bacteroidota bacterium]
MVAIFTPVTGPRLRYVLDELLLRRAGIPYRLHLNAAQYEQDPAAIKINYSSQELPGFTLYCSGWLQEKGINPEFKPSAAVIDGKTVLFPSAGGTQFDLFAMAFWLLSRYEEYQPFAADVYHRFPATASLAHTLETVQEPWLDAAILQFYRQSGIPFVPRLTTIPTIDVDIAFKYLGRPLLRRWGAWCRDLLLSPENRRERRQVQGPQSDPFYTYDYIHSALQPFEESRIFWLVPVHYGKHDKQVSTAYKPFQKLLGSLHIPAGLHPSWASGDYSRLIYDEKHLLEKATGQSIQSSRQHFLRMRLPQSYSLLLQAGFTHDYTMGYADACGFRAGTAYTFLWYNLETDTETGLHIHPFVCMDVTCKNYLKLSPDSAIQLGAELKNKMAETGGDFCFVYHNESLSESSGWKGWRNVFEAWLK